MVRLHPDLSALAFLLGKWEGNGKGTYLTVDDFTYGERVSFTAPPGRPFLAYLQRTWRTGEHPESGEPLHTEVGYLRPGRGNRAELVLAQPTGIVEVHLGTITGTSLALKATTVATTPTATDITSVERTLVVRGDDLSYELLLGTAEQPHQLHLKATLKRVA